MFYGEELFEKRFLPIPLPKNFGQGYEKEAFYKTRLFVTNIL